MADVTLHKKKVDPSESIQSFTDIHIQLHCCRYWMLTEWECTNLDFPFWRIYHNGIEGASILYKGVLTELTPDKIVIIPPNTSFYNCLKSDIYNITRESISGRSIESVLDLEKLEGNKKVDHLFIHFNLGLPYDFIQPGIYSVDVNVSTAPLIEALKKKCIDNSISFDFKTCLHIHNLIIYLLSNIPNDIWQNGEMDQRIIKCMQCIQKNTHERHTNESLASMANMATNSFARLFKTNTGESVQQYILKRRIEKACILLHHSNESIDNIAHECGFCDRYHFSKAFKQILSMSPGYYKKHLTFK